MFPQCVYSVFLVLTTREIVLEFIAPLTKAKGFTKEILPSGGGRQYRFLLLYWKKVWISINDL